MKASRIPLIVLIGAVIAAAFWSNKRLERHAYEPAQNGAGITPSLPAVAKSDVASPKPVLSPEPSLLPPGARSVSGHALVHEVMAWGFRRDEKREARVIELARRLSPRELLGLADLVVDPKSSADRRNAAVYILSEAGAIAQPALTKIVVTPFDDRPGKPHSIQDAKRQGEVSLRVSALEALDQLGASGSDVRASLQKASLQKNTTLQFLARIALSGIEQGRPGKLSRFIDASMDEAMGKKQ